MPAFDAIGMDAVGANSSTTASTNGTASGAVLTGTSAFSGGAASGTSAGGNRSATAGGAALTGTSSMRAGAASGGTAQTGLITVPTSRTAVFAGVPRVVVFDGKAPVSRAKGALDELYFVANLTKDLSDANTLAQSVTYVSFGVAVLEGPTLQGSFCIVKLGALDTTIGAKNYFTFRVTCANGEQFDRTMLIPTMDDRTWTFGKDPDDIHYYAFDLSADAALGDTTVFSASAPVPVGVSASPGVVIQDSLSIVSISGLNTGISPVNSCNLTVTFANTEKISRTIYFTKEDH